MNSQASESKGQFLNIHQDLIDGCKKGDQKAQFQIYKLYYKAMYNTSLRIVNDTMEAEDIMQESFLTAFEKIGMYSGTVSFGAWLKKIVQNQSLDMLRRKNKVTFEDLEAINEVEEAITENSEFKEENDQKVIKVMETLKKLPEKCQEVLSLYLFEGFDHDEIGEILSIPGSTARSQYSRARQRLVREFEGN
jgi:RNA polymerase sigma factor (sigma-70 family)